MDNSASKFALYFVLRANQSKRQAIDPLSLQKLLYYAQAWHLVFCKKPLFRDPIEAWVYGPVIPSIYHRLKNFRYHKISEVALANGNISWNDSELSTLNEVWRQYGQRSGGFLVELTHTEQPWLKARHGLLPSQPSHRIIGLMEMYNYYRQFFDSKQPKTIPDTALQQKKEKQHHSSLNNILDGLGSILNIYPDEPEDKLATLQQALQDPNADSAALASDWGWVGHDFNNALNNYLSENNND